MPQDRSRRDSCRLRMRYDIITATATIIMSPRGRLCQIQVPRCAAMAFPQPVPPLDCRGGGDADVLLIAPHATVPADNAGSPAGGFNTLGSSILHG